MGMDFPNLPHWIDGEQKLAESTAVHQYLASKYCPKLLGTTAQERGIIRMAENVIYADFNEKLNGLCYAQDDMNTLEQGTLGGLKPIEKFL